MLVPSWTSLDRGRALHGNYISLNCSYRCFGYIYDPKKLKTLPRYLFYDTTLQIDNGLMTPTMKIRRDKVVAKYKDEINQLYN